MNIKTLTNFKPVAQEHPLGCSVACIASLCNLSYQDALKLFAIPDLAWIRGFYCNEVVQALAQVNLDYIFEEFELSDAKEKITKPGTIVFVAPNSKYPSGHFLLRQIDGWMNPWSNFPQMIPIESKIEKSLPGEVSYLIYQRT